MSKRELFIILGIVTFAPIVVAIGVSLPILRCIDNTSPWIGFWGSYVGSIFGGIITLIVLKKTLDNNKDILDKTIQAESKKDEQNRKLIFLDDICDQFIKLSSDMITSIPERNAKKLALLHVSASMLKTRLKSRQNEYINCDAVLEKLDILTQKFTDLMYRVMDEHEVIKWNEIAIEFGKIAGSFNDQIEDFYEDNIRKLLDKNT